jgi:c-di-AMP phosphodiesterase-like protein
MKETILFYVLFSLFISCSPSKIDKENYNDVNHCIVVGDGLEATKSYQLLIDVDSTQVNKIMTKQEYNTIKKVIDALDHTTKYPSPTSPLSGQKR